MKNFLLSIIALGPLVLSGAAAAQSVVQIKGAVLVNHGKGFGPAQESEGLEVGSRVQARAKSSAFIQYPGGCRVKVEPGRIVTVLASPPCVATGAPPPDPVEPVGFDPTYAIIGGVVVVGGGILLLNSTSDDKPTSP